MIRAASAAISVCVAATLVTRIHLKMSDDGLTVFAALWDNYRYFTMWTNTLVGLLCAYIASGGRPAHWAGATLALAITVVAGVYHAILAQNNDFTGIDLVVDQMLHTAIPAGFVLFWLVLLPKADLALRSLVFILGYPLSYCIYALARGAMDGVYPYGFLNVTNLGASGVAVNVAGLVVVFAMGGFLMLGLGRLEQRRA